MRSESARSDLMSVLRASSSAFNAAISACSSAASLAELSFKVLISSVNSRRRSPLCSISRSLRFNSAFSLSRPSTSRRRTLTSSCLLSSSDFNLSISRSCARTSLRSLLASPASDCSVSMRSAWPLARSSSCLSLALWSSDFDCESASAVSDVSSWRSNSDISAPQSASRVVRRSRNASISVGF